jgi:hypothetical protein
LAGLFAAGVYLSLDLFFTPACRPGGDPRAAAGLLALVFDAVLAGVLVLDLHFALSALFFDSDLDLLRAAPLPPGKLFATKLLDSAAYTPTLLLALGLPAAAAFLRAAAAPWWAWALLLPVILGLWLLAVGPGACGALLLARHLAPRRLRELLSLMGTLLLAGVWLANGVLGPRLAQPGMDLLGALRAADSPPAIALALSPGHWAARALAAAAGGHLVTALAWTAALAAAATLVLGVGLRLAASSLDAALASARLAPSRLGRRPHGRTLEPVTGVLRAVVRKDARLVARDWSLLGDVLVAALVWSALPLVGAPLIPGPRAAVMTAALVVLAGGLGYEVAARAVPLERSGFALLIGAPHHPARWLVAKLAGSSALAGAVYAAAGVSLALGLRVPAPVAWRAAGWGALALTTALCGGLALGTRFADFGWTNPRAMLVAGGRGLAALGLVLQAVLWLGLAWPYAGRQAAPLGSWPLGAAIAAALCAVMLAAAGRRLRRAEWLG